MLVHDIARPGEVEGQEDEFLGVAAVRDLLVAGLRDAPAVLDLLGEAIDVVFHLLSRPESHLFRRYHPSTLHKVGQPSQDHPLYELTEVARERDGMIAGDSPQQPPRRLLQAPHLGVFSSTNPFLAARSTFGDLICRDACA